MSLKRTHSFIWMEMYRVLDAVYRFICIKCDWMEEQCALWCRRRSLRPTVADSSSVPPCLQCDDAGGQLSDPCCVVPCVRWHRTCCEDTGWVRSKWTLVNQNGAGDREIERNRTRWKDQPSVAEDSSHTEMTSASALERDVFPTGLSLMLASGTKYSASSGLLLPK